MCRWDIGEKPSVIIVCNRLEVKANGKRAVMINEPTSNPRQERKFVLRILNILVAQYTLVCQTILR